jgi:hypothetical protein
MQHCFDLIYCGKGKIFSVLFHVPFDNPAGKRVIIPKNESKDNHGAGEDEEDEF